MALNHFHSRFVENQDTHANPPALLCCELDDARQREALRTTREPGSENIPSTVAVSHHHYQPGSVQNISIFHSANPHEVLEQTEQATGAFHLYPLPRIPARADNLGHRSHGMSVRHYTLTVPQRRYPNQAYDGRQGNPVHTLGMLSQVDNANLNRLYRNQWRNYV